MNVAVRLSIDLDAEAWAEYNGLGDLSEVREDVRTHVLNHVQGSEILMEADATVVMR